MSRKLSNILICSLFGLFIIGQGKADDGIGITDIQSDEVEKDVLANAVNDFGYKLMMQMINDKEEKNVVISPTGIAGLLAMSLLGSVGRSYDELAESLGFSQDVRINRKNHELFGDILRELNSNNTSSKTMFTDALFIDGKSKLREAYRNYLARVYQGDAIGVNFTDRNTVRTLINEWVNNSTKGKIPVFLKETLPADTQAVLLSALYFSGQWETPFVPEYTMKMPFTKTKDEVMADMMLNLGNFKYVFSIEEEKPGHRFFLAFIKVSRCAQDWFVSDMAIGLPFITLWNGITVEMCLHQLYCNVPLLTPMGYRHAHMIALPYNDSITTMYALKPKRPERQNLTELLNRLSYSKINKLIDEMGNRKSIIRFPKMDLKAVSNLENPLKQLGIRSIFVPGQANFALMIDGKKEDENKKEEEIITRINDGHSLVNDNLRKVIDALPNPGVHVDSILHDVRITIDEYGTEAVAATIGILARSAEMFYANSPFYIFIRNEKTKLITFSAVIFDPTS